MSKTFALAFRRLILLLICTLPLSSHAASSKEAPLDLSIIEQRDALRPHMNAQQQLAFLKATKMIEAGESTIRSGTSLVQRKPSALNPKEDLRPIHERGKRMIEEGQMEIKTGQRMLVELLTHIESQRSAASAQAAKKFNFSLIEHDYQTALNLATENVLQICRKAGYKHIFFDELHITQDAQSDKAAPEIRNAAYDVFIKADGTRFNVQVPLGLELTKDENASAYSFHYENSAAFEGENIALLAIEIISPGHGTDALLSVRALDLDTQKLVASSLFYIPDASELLDNGTAEGDITSKRSIPEEILIRDEQQLIETLAGIANPYLFETATGNEASAQTILLDILLKDTLLKNSALILVESAFVQRAYLAKKAESGELKSPATATLQITPDSDSYSIAAQAHGSPRVIEIGSITLKFPEGVE
jgi:hypothetical protein